MINHTLDMFNSRPPLTKFGGEVNFAFTTPQQDSGRRTTAWKSPEFTSQPSPRSRRPVPPSGWIPTAYGIERISVLQQR